MGAERKATPIDDYLRTAPEDRRGALEDLRAKIRSVVPVAEECVSYGMPAFRLPGGVVAGFQATKKGGTAPATGVREWIEGVEALDGRVVTFSTTTGGLLAGSAGKAIVKGLKRRRIRAEHGADFTVNGTPGPVSDGELERARQWGRTLLGGPARP